MTKKKMLALCLLLMFGVGCCINDQVFEIKTVAVKEDVTLSCTRKKSEHGTVLFWTRLISGRLPESLGATYAFDYDGVHTNDHITVKQAHATFILQINEATLNDGGIYFCIKVNFFTMTFLKVIYLNVEGAGPFVVAVIQVPPSDPVRSVTMHCSVLSDSANKPCSGGHSVCWFSAGSDESNLGLIYSPGYSDDECDSSPEVHATQDCVQNLSTKISSSYAGSYSCAMATCGEIQLGKLQLDSEEPNIEGLQNDRTALFLLVVALATSLIINAYLIYVKFCGSRKPPFIVNMESDAAGTSDQQNQQRDKSVIYATPTFTERKLAKAGRRNLETTTEETIYSDIRTFEME